MDNQRENTSHIKVNTGLERVSKQIDVTNKLLQNIDAILIPYRKKDRWGFCTPDKKIVIECVYEKAFYFREGLAAVKNGVKWGFIDKSGSQVIPFIYQDATVFSEGLAIVILNDKMGYIDLSDEPVIPFIYNNNQPYDPLNSYTGFIGGIARIVLNNKKEYIDKKGTQYWED